MYNNLKRVLKEKGITNVMLAEFLGVSEKTASNKLNGNTDFTLAEAMKINKLLCPEYTMDFLFAVYLEAS